MNIATDYLMIVFVAAGIAIASIPFLNFIDWLETKK